MIERTAVNTFRVGLVLVVALAAAVVANIVLLGVANGPRDPVGRLSPRAGLVKLSTTIPTAPTTPTPGRTTTQPQDDGRIGAHPDD